MSDVLWTVWQIIYKPSTLYWHMNQCLVAPLWNGRGWETRKSERSASAGGPNDSLCCENSLLLRCSWPVCSAFANIKIPQAKFPHWTFDDLPSSNLHLHLIWWPRTTQRRLRLQTRTDQKLCFDWFHLSTLRRIGKRLIETIPSRCVAVWSVRRGTGGSSLWHPTHVHLHRKTCTTVSVGHIAIIGGAMLCLSLASSFPCSFSGVSGVGGGGIRLMGHGSSVLLGPDGQERASQRALARDRGGPGGR